MIVLKLLAVAALAIVPAATADPSLDKFCQGVTAGIFPHPDPQLCYMFISCVFEQHLVYQCDKGFVFDETVSECVSSNWADCGRDVTPPADDVCINVSYGFFEYEGDCGKFVFCERGAATVFECLKNEIWSQEEGVCVFGNRETCQPGDVFCMGRPDGVIPHPEGCDRYIECVNERSSEGQCTRGKIFVEGGTGCVIGSVESCLSAEHVCDKQPQLAHPHPDFCDVFIECNDGQAVMAKCGANEIFLPSIRFCVPGNTATCVPSRPETACEGRADGIIPHPDECDQYIVCSGGSSTVRDCPTGQILRPEVPICVTGNSDTCQFMDDVCLRRPNGFVIEHPNYCGWFIWCDNQQAHVYQCPAGEILRPDMQFCVPGIEETCEVTPIDRMCEGRPGPVIYPHPDRCDQYIRCEGGNLNVNTCDPYTIVQPGTIQCVPGNTDTCELYSDLCSTRPDGVIPHPSRCHLFITCRGGQALLNSCQVGHIFDSSESRCVPGNTETCDHLVEHCVGRPDGVVPHPNRCDLFMICTNGVTAVHPCPGGEILRPDMQFCAPGDPNTCQFAPVEEMCDGRSGEVIYPHPDDCSVLVRCTDGELTVERCQDGTVLKPGSLQCVVGNSNTCEVYGNQCTGVDQSSVPHPSECHLFVRCSSGSVSVDSCSRGTIFVNGQCVIGDRDECTSLQHTCGALRDSIIPHPNFCDLFLECRNGLTSMNPCPPGLILHKNMQVCSPGDVNSCKLYATDDMCRGRNQGRFPPPDQSQCQEFVRCENEVARTDSCQDGTVLRPRFIDCVPGNEDSCEAFPHICLFRPNEFIPHPVRCDLFVSCISEIPHVEACSRGEIFQPEAGLCVPGNALSCETFAGVCSGEDNTNLPHPKYCDVFIACKSGTAHVQACPSKQIFDPKLRLCLPGNADTCELSPGEDICLGQQDGIFLPHPEICSSFIECRQGTLYIIKCPVGNIFLPSSSRCVPGNAQTCQLYNDQCSDQPDGVIEFPSRCDLFLLCNSGVTSAHPCPEGEILNIDIQFCVPGDAETCLFHEVTTAPQPPLNAICETLPDGRYSHPFHCYLFIQCSGGETLIESCPPGQIWVQNVRECAPGDWSTCRVDEAPGDITDEICVHAGIYVLPHPFVCYKYIVCVFRSASVEECPRWHIFSTRRNVCVLGDRNNC